MLSRVRRRLVFVVVMLALAAACSPSPGASVESARPEAPQLVPAPPSLSPAPQGPRYADPTAPRPGPPLPEPVNIPADSYAPEPVREIGTMEIPAIGLHHRLYQGVTLHNIDLGPSHWTGSALPGERGNAVVAGHRATHSEPFRRIDELVPGDEVVFAVDGARSTYRVTGHLVVQPSDTWIADQTQEFTATLYACHPVGSMAERYVVQLELA